MDIKRHHSIFILSLVVLGSVLLSRTGETCLTEDRPDVRLERLQGRLGISVYGVKACARLEEKATKGTWGNYLRVYVLEGKTWKKGGQKIPLAGTFSVSERNVHFLPRYPFIEGTAYLVWLDRDRLTGRKESFERRRHVFKKVFTIPRIDTKPLRVLKIYPTTGAWPVNTLRCYVQFNQPVKGRTLQKRIKLFGGDDNEIKGAFLRTPEWLWDSTGTRLTLYFHPGRVKTGLVAHRRMGRVLQEGHRYQLLLLPGILAANGQRLNKTYKRHFLVTKEDTNIPDVKRWTLRAPLRDTRQGLHLSLDEALDHSLLKKLLRVVDQEGKEVAGKILLQNGEKAWVFIPKRRWKSHLYHLYIDRTLEDLAGNNLYELFDKPLKKKSGISRFATIPFQAKAR